MTSDNTDRKHHHNPLQDHELEPDEVHEVVEFLRRNGRSIAIAIAIGVAASLGLIFYRNSQRQKRMYAARALAGAESLEALAAVAQDYAGTPSAPIAILKEAAIKFEMGEYEAAASRYEEFQAQNPDHEMADASSVALALCAEAKGDKQTALQQLEEFLRDKPDSFMRPLALFARARILGNSGQLDEERAIYEDFIAANPDSLWIEQAETALLAVKQRIRAAAEDS